MTSTTARPTIFVGVDTHADTHHVGIVNEHGKKFDDREFDTTATGYAETEKWIRSSGLVARVGIEGTGSYGEGRPEYGRSLPLRP
ncbi:IS110 family transposase [Nocardia australiensis]|uniref:IS110 family transposase n=1 Tax=Nocardia australiensis TaxID=2887191 RepID=UPI001D15160D|nr:transposase [Nocardia australiensis]